MGNLLGTPATGRLDRCRQCSYRCPTLHAYISISDKACPGHSTALRDATITPHALDQMAKGAAVIAEMVLTVFNDAGYRVAVQKRI